MLEMEVRIYRYGENNTNGKNCILVRVAATRRGQGTSFVVVVAFDVARVKKNKAVEAVCVSPIIRTIRIELHALSIVTVTCGAFN
jgi:acid stress-induced BolA-like protein IbaG/YrbA